MWRIIEEELLTEWLRVEDGVALMAVDESAAEDILELEVDEFGNHSFAELSDTEHSLSCCERHLHEDGTVDVSVSKGDSRADWSSSHLD